MFGRAKGTNAPAGQERQGDGWKAGKTVSELGSPSRPRTALGFPPRKVLRAFPGKREPWVPLQWKFGRGNGGEVERWGKKKGPDCTRATDVLILLRAAK